MKCKECPLFYETCCSTEDGTEYDVECAAGEYFGWRTPFDWDTGGCRRTNKWILAQSKDDLLNKRWQAEADAVEEYMNELLICETCSQKVKRMDLATEKAEYNYCDKTECYDCAKKARGI